MPAASLSASSPDKSPLQTFFKRYSPGFKYDPQQPANTEFQLLCIHKGWPEGVELERQAKWARQITHDRFKAALVEQFSSSYGTDAGSLAAWQVVCGTAKLVPIPKTVREVRMTLTQIDINVVDIAKGCNKGKQGVVADKAKKLGKDSDVTTKDRVKASRAARREVTAPYSPSVVRRLSDQALKTRKLVSYHDLTIDAHPCCLRETPQAGPVQAFFDQFSGFNYHPTNEAYAEFRRLCNYMEWEKGNSHQTDAWGSFRDALVLQFKESYGTDGKAGRAAGREVAAPYLPPVVRRASEHTLKTRNPKTPQAGPLPAFFEQFFGFNYDPTNEAHAEFRRLCNYMEWKRGNSDQKNAWGSFNSALVLQFNENYGTDENDLASWQTLCVTLGIDPVPDDLQTAQRVVSGTHVNLVDLTQGFKGARKITIFPTERQLSEYTMATKKFFPRSNVNAGSLLEALLRHIFNPSTQENEWGEIMPLKQDVWMPSCW